MNKRAVKKKQKNMKALFSTQKLSKRQGTNSRMYCTTSIVIDSLRAEVSNCEVKANRKRLGSAEDSRKLLTYPSHNPTLTLTSCIVRAKCLVSSP